MQIFDRNRTRPALAAPSGKGGALPRRPPLRPVLAVFLAHGSSKPLGQGGLQLQCCAPARACLEGAVAGGMYQGCGSLGVPHAILPEWSWLAVSTSFGPTFSFDLAPPGRPSGVRVLL